MATQKKKGSVVVKKTKSLPASSKKAMPAKKVVAKKSAPVKKKVVAKAASVVKKGRVVLAASYISQLKKPKVLCGLKNNCNRHKKAVEIMGRFFCWLMYSCMNFKAVPIWFFTVFVEIFSFSAICWCDNPSSRLRRYTSPLFWGNCRTAC